MFHLRAWMLLWISLTHQVRRLYDTFHEPFKRVVSTHPDVPETPAEKNTEPLSTGEDVDGKKTEDAGKLKKEPDLTIKSALSAAFAKYGNKIGKSNSRSQGEEKEETSVPLNSEPESSNLQ